MCVRIVQSVVNPWYTLASTNYGRAYMHYLPSWEPTPPVLEPVVRTKITELLEAVGFNVWWIEQSSDRKRSRGRRTVGVPDIYAVHASRPVMVWIECKGIGSGHEATDEQLRFRERIVAAGWQCVIGHNNMESKGGYTEVCEALKAWGICK